MLHSDLAKERRSFYYVLITSALMLLTISVLFQSTTKTLPIAFITTTVIAFFIFTLLNAEAVMGFRNAITLKTVSFIITFTGEVVGVNYGWIFGSYDYTSALGVKLLGVPLLVIFAWDIFIYGSYMLVTHTVNFRFTKTTPTRMRLWIAALVALLTGLATTAIDLIVDPIAIHFGWWTWEHGGSYFPEIAGGVPVSNFLGWIFLSSLAVFIFKGFLERPHKEKETVFEYASVIPYLATILLYGIIGTGLGLHGPTLVATFAMSTFILFFALGKTLRVMRLPKELV